MRLRNGIKLGSLPHNQPTNLSRKPKGRDVLSKDIQEAVHAKDLCLAGYLFTAPLSIVMSEFKLRSLQAAGSYERPGSNPIRCLLPLTLHNWVADVDTPTKMMVVVLLLRSNAAPYIQQRRVSLSV